jgi:integrase
MNIDSDLSPIEPNNIELIESHPAFRNFINSLKSPHTKLQYRDILFRYFMIPVNKNQSIDEILSKDPKVIEYEIVELLTQMKEERNLSYSTLNVFFCSIAHFYEMNDVVLNKRKIKKFMGENITKYEYKSYTTEMISALLDAADDRGRVMVLLMASTGMRVGALQDIKLKHLKRWLIDDRGTHIYQTLVYANSKKYNFS